MSTQGLICSQSIDLQDLNIITPHSHIANSFTMTYDGFDALNNIEELVNIKSHLEGSHVGLQDLMCFSDNLTGSPNVLN